MASKKKALPFGGGNPFSSGGGSSGSTTSGANPFSGGNSFAAQHQQQVLQQKQDELTKMQEDAQTMSPQDFLANYKDRLDALGVQVPQSTDTHPGQQHPGFWGHAWNDVNPFSSTSFWERPYQAIMGAITNPIEQSNKKFQEVYQPLLDQYKTEGKQWVAQHGGKETPLSFFQYAEEKQAQNPSLPREQNTGLGDFLSGAWKGLKGADQYSGARLLQDTGVKNKWASGLGGGALDIFLDPTTYMGVGAITDIGKAAEGVQKAFNAVNDMTKLVHGVQDLKSADQLFAHVNDAKNAIKAAQAAGTADEAMNALNTVSGSLGKIHDLTTSINGPKDLIKSAKNAGSSIDAFLPNLQKMAKAGEAPRFGLAATKAEQASKGERALLKFAGKPLVKGAPVFEGLGKLGEATKIAPIVSGFKGMFTSTPNIARMAGVGSEAKASATSLVKGIPKAAAADIYPSAKRYQEFMKAVPNVADQEAIMRHIEDPTAALRNGLQPWETFLKQDMQKRLQMENKVGLPTQELRTGGQLTLPGVVPPAAADYMGHEFSKEFRQEVLGKNPIPSPKQASPPFLKERQMRESVATINAQKQADAIRTLENKVQTATLLGKTDEATHLQGMLDQVKSQPFVNMFETRAPVAGFQRNVQSAFAIARADALNKLGEVKDLAGNPLVRKADAAAPLAQDEVRLGGAFKDWVAKSDIATEIQKPMARMQDKGVQEFVQKFYDPLVSSFKSFATLANPGWYTKIFAGQWWNQYLGFGAKGLSPQRRILSDQMVSRAKKAYSAGDTALKDPWWDKTLTSAEGNVTNLRDLYHNAEKQGFQRGLISRVETGGPGERPLMDLIGGKPPVRNFNPISGSNVVFAKGRQAVSTILEHSRMTGYMNGWMQAGDFQKAGDLMKKYLFDYSDLAPTEKNVFRRVMPFYAFSRKNLPLEVSQLLEQPGKFVGVGKVTRAAENVSGVDMSNTPGYFPELNALPLPFKIGGENQFLNPAMPFQTLNMLAHPQNEFVSMLGPPFKQLLETAMGHEAFSNTPIGGQTKFDKKYNPLVDKLLGAPVIGGPLQHLLGAQRIEAPGQPGSDVWGINPVADYLVRQNPFLQNVGKATNYANPSPGKWPADLLSTLAGIKLMPYNQPNLQNQVGWQNVKTTEDYLNQLQRQQGVPTPTISAIHDYMRYQAGKPTQSLADFAQAGGMDPASTDTKSAYTQYLKQASGTQYPLKAQDVQTLSDQLSRKQASLPEETVLQDYLRYAAGQRGQKVYTPGSFAKMNKLDPYSQTTKDSYMTYLEGKAGVKLPIQPQELNQFDVANWLGQLDMPSAASTAKPKSPKAFAPKKKAKKAKKIF